MPPTARFTALFAGVLVGSLTSTGATAQEGADVESECQSEAALYEIPPEQRADYVAGCVTSRGGYLSTPPAEEHSASEYTDEHSDESAEAPLDTPETEPSAVDHQP
ncbi:MAG: hypothetical protein PVI91_00460 [Gammaproteobacteria bacterium]|jgi:hypothetical protein